MKLTGKKFLLLLLYSPIDNHKRSSINVPISGRTRLMKMGFLFVKEIQAEFKKDRTFDEIELPEYFAWHYGPFSKVLLNDLEFLINQQYIDSRISRRAPISAELDEYAFWVDDIEEFQAREYDEEVFRLTEDRGVPKTEELWEILSKNQKKLLIDFKTILNRAPLNRILDYVYKKYEEGYINKSIIREKYLS